MWNPYQTVGSAEWDWPRWDDLRFPAQAINPVGAAADAGIDDDTGLLMFSGVVDNIVAGVAQMPHGWMPGTTIAPHIHLIFPTSAAGVNTRWKFEYNRANRDADLEHAMGTYTTLTTVTVANPQNVQRHLHVDLADLTMSGYTESCIIIWRVSRLANSDAADTDTNPCALVEFDIHYRSNKLGSTKEHP